MKIILALWLIGGLIAFLFVALSTGIEKSHKNECIKWKQWDETISSHYIVDWQRQQCEQFEIYFDN